MKKMKFKKQLLAMTMACTMLFSSIPTFGMEDTASETTPIVQQETVSDTVDNKDTVFEETTNSLEDTNEVVAEEIVAPEAEIAPEEEPAPESDAEVAPEAESDTEIESQPEIELEAETQVTPETEEPQLDEEVPLDEEIFEELTILEEVTSPTFDTFNFLTSSFVSGEWVTNTTFDAEVYEYDLHLKLYTTSSIGISSTTSFDSEIYEVEITYTDSTDTEKITALTTNKYTSFTSFGYGTTDFVVCISEIANPENSTTYTFNITRPYADVNTFASTGIVVAPVGRDTLSIVYKGTTEGTFFQVVDGLETETTGIATTVNEYNAYFLDALESFSLTLTTLTTEEVVRYSTDDGITWTSVSDTITLEFDESNQMDVLVQLVSGNDMVYNNGFDDPENINTYVLHICSVEVASNSAQILTAVAETGYISAPFTPENNSYLVLQENGVTTDTISYTVSEGATAWLGDVEQIPENGQYTLALTTSNQTIDVVAEDGTITNAYVFRAYTTSAADMPDYVVDYLPINSQYTNATTGMYPEYTLMGTVKSLGNFGGYITYYYENGITNNPNNMYGMDFYVNGNSSSVGGSLGEVGQVWVSEDNETWYALAGSEHYEDSTIWDYEVTYSKLSSGKTAWVDNQGNSNSGTSYTGAYPIASNYPLHDFTGESKEITLTGIVLPSQEDGTIMGSGTTASFAAATSFGYVDYYTATTYPSSNNYGVLDKNSYIASPANANGFDLAWAVDADGLPIDVEDKEFHYVKVVTASNIWAGAFGEKSTEVAAVIRTTPQEDTVGTTEAPERIVISSVLGDIPVNIEPGKTVYSVSVENAKYISISVENTNADDNVYVNNQRIADGDMATGFVVTEDDTALVRVIVQNGDQEPVIYLLQLTGNASSDVDGIEAMYVDVAGSVREATKGNDGNYTASVAYTIDSIGILPITTEGYTINEATPEEAYALATGTNIFTIATENQTVLLTITKGSAPTTTQNNTVSVTIYGDSQHDTDEVHVFSQNASDFELFLKKTYVTVTSGATAWDALKTAMDAANISYENGSGNYITEVDGLAEFDNGALSGWLYMVNGKYPDYGVNEYVLSNGDAIILHYTDDYTQEEASKDFSSSGSGSVEEELTEEELAEELLEESEETTEEVTEVVPIKEFTDVTEDNWYFAAVQYVSEAGLFSGIGENDFAPNMEMTRAMFFSVLLRMSGDTYEESEVWYESGMHWAVENGVSDGTNPQNNMTREELVTMLWRYAGKPDVEMTKFANYEDATEVSSWAESALLWAVSEGIVSGTTTTTLSPKNETTRAEVAMILMKYLQLKETQIQ